MPNLDVPFSPVNLEAATGFVTRFAPSPTGRLHLGHAYSALTAWRAARAVQGRFLLRIEDIDLTRCKPEFTADIFTDLTWFGLTWDGPVRRQSEHLADYATVVDVLDRRGLLYRCFRSRKDIETLASAPHGPFDPTRPGPHSPEEEAEYLGRSAPFAWRLSLDRARDALGTRTWDNLAFFEEGQGPSGQRGRILVQPELTGDIVVARKDAGTAYHVAVTHDDALQGVTHVIRGEDLFDATHVQVLLQALMGWPTPIYHHHRLITDEHGKRLAKRDLAETLAELRATGINPATLRAGLCDESLRGSD